MIDKVFCARLLSTTAPLAFGGTGAHFNTRFRHVTNRISTEQNHWIHGYNYILAPDAPVLIKRSMFAIQKTTKEGGAYAPLLYDATNMAN